MAKMGKAQYDLLTEAFGDALGKVKDKQSRILEDTAIGVIRRVADYLASDSKGFDRKLFLEQVQAIGELAQLNQKNNLYDHDANMRALGLYKKELENGDE